MNGNSIALDDTRKFKGLSASEIKYIAILAMLIDHIAWKFVPIETPLAQLMHCLGRITAPIMCFFISEGFHHTKNFKSYIKRMAIFAFISHFAYIYYSSGDIKSALSLNFGKTSVIFTLMICLLTLYLYNHTSIPNMWKYIGILLLLFISEYGDWGSLAVLFTLAFEIGRDNKKNQIICYICVATIYKVFPLINQLISYKQIVSNQIYNLGVFLAVPILIMYNGTRGGSKSTKWIFYIFYPLHIVILGYLYYNY